MTAQLLALHLAAGRQAARRIIAHPERHGPQRIMVAWCALNGVRRVPPPVTPRPRRDWWTTAAVIERGLRDDGAFDFSGGNAA